MVLNMIIKTEIEVSKQQKKVNSVFSAFKDHYIYNVFDEKHHKLPLQKYQ